MTKLAPQGDTSSVIGSSAPSSARQRAFRALLVVALLTLALHWLPVPIWLHWPILLGSTLAHEFGHGLAALLLGGSFESLALFADGSGVASYRGHFNALQGALIAAAGLLGPPIAASLLLLAARHERSSRIALMGCALFCALLVLLWAGNLLTLFYAGVMGLGLAALALRGTPVVLQWSSLFIAVQLGLASFSRADYLFTAVAQTSAGPMPSDVAQIEAALWLPYWVWGAGLAVLSALLLAGSSGLFLRSLAVEESN
ncbi:MAG: M50 family metallopeptidase [Xanthomonadales bacterium]|nr:M50 family metallopeptidase [Xanthomonadales bacterium]